MGCDLRPWNTGEAGGELVNTPLGCGDIEVYLSPPYKADGEVAFFLWPCSSLGSVGAVLHQGCAPHKTLFL